MNKECDRRHDGAEKHVEATGVAALLVPLWCTSQNEAGKELGMID